MPDEQQTQTSGVRRLGNGMVMLAWIIFLGLLAWLFGQYLDRQRNPNRDIVSERAGGETRIILEQNRGGHYVATARINGRPADVLLDTGATSISIPAGMAARLDLSRGPELLMNTANGAVSVYATRLREVRLGDIVLYDVAAHINPHMNEDFALLGMSFLKQLEFTQRGNRLILERAD